MTTLTIELPETLTEQLQAYGISQQQVQSLVTTFMQNYLHQYQAQYDHDDAHSPSLPPDVETALAELDQASDDQLWDIAQTAVAQVDVKTLEYLSDKQKSAGLTATEQTQAQALLNRYDQAVLMRAKAIALLKQRGCDIAPLLQPPADS